MAPELTPNHQCDHCPFVNRLVEAGRKAVAAFTIQSKLKRANAMQELSDVLKEFDEKAENYDLVSSIDNKQPYETWRTN